MIDQIWHTELFGVAICQKQLLCGSKVDKLSHILLYIHSKGPLLIQGQNPAESAHFANHSAEVPTLRFQQCSPCISTVQPINFNSAVHQFQQCSPSISTAQPINFNSAAHQFQQCSPSISTVQPINFNSAAHQFQQCSPSVSVVQPINFSSAALSFQKCRPYNLAY